jgi:hypothetical protein
MATTSLEGTNISETYIGILHAKGEKLPKSGQESIFDGSGNESSLKLGRKGSGATIEGELVIANNITLSANTNTNITAAYPRIQFGRFDNTDSMYITRANSGQDRSELRVNIADNINSTQDKFVIGGTTHPLTAFRPLMSLSGDGNMCVQLATHTTAYQRPRNWGGGVTSFDFYSDGGTFGAGRGGSLSAYMNRDGLIFGSSITSKTITATSEINAPNTAKSYGYAKTANFTNNTQTFNTAVGYNFASVTWQSRGCYRVTFNEPMSNDQYAVILQNAYMRNVNDPHLPSSGYNEGDENKLLLKHKTTSYFEFICWTEEKNLIENLTGFCFVVFGS